MSALPRRSRPARAARVRLPYGVVLVIGLVLLLVGAAEEPYHVDELRQVSTYGDAPGAIVDANLRQTQPPLDALLGAAFQRVVGVGDVRQRLTSVMAGVVALIALSWLCIRGALAATGWLAVALIVSSPLFIRLTAYARPYALPLALMLAFVVVAQRWLARGTTAQLGSAVLLALLLPLSRTTEPTVFLVAVAGVMTWQAVRGDGDGRRRAAVLAAVAGTAVALVSLPVYLAVRAHARSYIADESTSLLEQLSRLATDLPVALSDAFSPWPLTLGLVLASVLFPRSRRLLFAMWWWWVLLAVPVVFAAAFFVTTPVDQPFFTRYAFFALPPVAVCLSALGMNVREWTAPSRVMRTTLLAGILALLLAQGASAVRLLTTQANADFGRAVEVLLEETGEETVVLYDRTVPLGQYRGAFWGGRYLAAQRQVITVSAFARRPGTVSRDEQVVVLLLSSRPPEVIGWRASRIDNFFTLYVPHAQHRGSTGVRRALATFVAAVDDGEDAAFRVALAAVLDRQGQEKHARRVVAPLFASEETAAAAREELEAAGLSRLAP